MSSECPYVSRGGLKLAAALDAFGINPADYVCADLGSNVGGFVDCLLQRGVKKVYAVDTGYGVLAYKLRIDPRVVVMERKNAMHVDLPEPVDLVTIDVAWTPQHRILPNAAKLLRTGGRIITLIKPHYEAKREQLYRGVLKPDSLPEVLAEIWQRIEQAGRKVSCQMKSPVSGGKGNLEYLALLYSD